MVSRTSDLLRSTRSVCGRLSGRGWQSWRLTMSASTMQVELRWEVVWVIIPIPEWLHNLVHEHRNTEAREEPQWHPHQSFSGQSIPSQLAAADHDPWFQKQQTAQLAGPTADLEYLFVNCHVHTLKHTSWLSIQNILYHMMKDRPWPCAAWALRLYFNIKNEWSALQNGIGIHSSSSKMELNIELITRRLWLCSLRTFVYLFCLYACFNTHTHTHTHTNVSHASYQAVYTGFVNTSYPK